MQATLSWRVTSPLRWLRRRPWSRSAAVQRAPDLGAPVRNVARTGSTDASEATGDAHAAALRASIALLGPEATAAASPEATSIDALATAVVRTALEPVAAAWLALFGATARYPTAEALEGAARRLRLFGPNEFRRFLVCLSESAMTRGPVPVELALEQVVVDVTHTLTTDLNTGVQRTVRAAVAGWVADQPAVLLVAFDSRWGCWRRVRSGALEAGRGARVVPDLDELCEPAVLLPWRCRLLLPEIAGEPERCAAYRAARAAGALGSIGVIGFDLVPVVAPETTSTGMSEYFAHYLSVVKRADRITAISESAAAGFRAFGEQCAAEGRAAPEVRVAIPGVDGPPDEEAIDAARACLSPDDGHLVLVVGSHEPRKNHGRILEAAELLWASGERFRLVFMGGNAWRSEAFDSLVEELRLRDRPVEVHHRADDRVVRGAYALARFTMFPSLIEGFGLPVLESLAAGTPVITSAHGAMAEVAAGGGCVTVDPRDVVGLVRAMRGLLTDDDLHGRLALEARHRPVRTWADFSRQAWAALTS